MAGGAQPVLGGLGGQPLAQGLEGTDTGCVQHWTYDPCILSNPVYALRLQLADTDFSSVGPSVARSQQSALFSDEEYGAFLAMAAGDVTLALVRALSTIANNRAIMAVAVNLGGGGTVDFTRMASELRAQAQALYELWCAIPADAYAEEDYGSFSAQRILWNQILRQTAY